MKNQQHIHLVDDKTGYCTICKKFEKKQIDSKQYVRLERRRSSTRVISYKRYICLDLCEGKLANRYKCCQVCETMCFYPIWCISLVLLLSLACIAMIVYLSYYFVTLQTTLKSYGETCNVTQQCNSQKGLTCKMNDTSGLYEESCNCPGLGIVNTCDCGSSHYWDGLTCAPVFSYGEGDCSGPYTCYKGLECDAYTAKCTCPTQKPVWNSKLKTCDYMYLGCFDSTYLYTNQSIKYDFSVLEVYLMSPANLFVELDDCLLVCKTLNKLYTHMLFNLYPRCACSNTYNNSVYTFKVDAVNCNSPCSLYNYGGQNRCPYTNSYYSSFQTGL